jgi:hypothetical protein
VPVGCDAGPGLGRDHRPLLALASDGQLVEVPGDLMTESTIFGVLTANMALIVAERLKSGALT